MIYDLQLQSAAATFPVSRDEAKAHCRIDHNDDDSYIDDLIEMAAARLDGADGILGRALITQTWSLTVDCFPSVAEGLRLPLGPVQSISEVTYVDPDGVTQTLSSSVYELRQWNDTGYLALKYGQSWPSVRRHPGAVMIEFVAGYGDASSDVPGPIRNALLQIIASAYEHREELIVGGEDGGPLYRNPTVRAMLAPYRALGGTG